MKKSLKNKVNVSTQRDKKKQFQDIFTSFFNFTNSDSLISPPLTNQNRDIWARNRPEPTICRTITNYFNLSLSKVYQPQPCRLVTPSMRALLFNWMILVSSQHGFMRQTSALATSYMDAYLLRNCNIKKQQLQISGFACIALAAKVEESKNLVDASKLFSMQDVRNRQLLILKALDYYMNPDTYMYWINLLMSFWDTYTTSTLTQYSHIRYFCNTNNSFRLSRQLYQISDSINMNILSVSTDKLQLCKNIFYIITKKNCLNLKCDNPQEFFESLSCEDDGFLSKFEQFMKIVGMGIFNPDKKLVSFIYRFLQLKINYDQPTIQQRESELQHYHQFICTQTYNEAMHPYVIKLSKL